VGHAPPAGFGRYTLDQLLAGWLRSHHAISERPLEMLAAGGPACRWFPLPEASVRLTLIDGQLSLADLLRAAGECMADGMLEDAAGRRYSPLDQTANMITPRDFVEWLAYRMYPAGDAAAVLQELGVR